MTTPPDPRMLKFLREQVRPLCEDARALNARIAAMATDWTSGIADLVSNDAVPIDDGRAAEGVTAITGAQFNQAVGNLIEMRAAGNDQILALPCVRRLDAV